MKIAYLVHNLNDAAVRRRVSLFEDAGFDVRLAGFHRDATIPDRVGKAPVTALGLTGDGALIRRILSVVRHVLRRGALRRFVGGAQVIVARNLETLVLARCVRQPSQRLVYECLDIHRLLLGRGVASRVLHCMERWALRGVDLVVVSAPAFRDRYFHQHIAHRGEVLLVENLVQRASSAMPAVIEPPAPPPWVIGWFGMLRCRRSLEMLKAMALNSGGRIEVLLAGRASTDLFPDFEAEVAASPGVSFAGAYTAADLPALFGKIHFVWAIDYFEEGLNSVWLLPNRLYESLAHGAVPVALRSVATGEWLDAHETGVLVDDPAAELPALIERITSEQYRTLRDAVARVPASAVIMDAAAADAAAHKIAGL